MEKNKGGPSRGRMFVAESLMRLAACFLMLASVSVCSTGQIAGFQLAQSRPSGGIAVVGGEGPASIVFDSQAPRPRDRRKAAAVLVLLAAAVVPFFARTRTYRTLQLALDVAVLGFWNGLFLSLSRIAGWAGSGLHAAPADFAAALLMLAMAFLWPLFGRGSHYCLWACPFGAAQDLSGRLFAKKSRLSAETVRRLETFRRALWAVLMLATICTGWARWMDWELFAAFAWRVVPVSMLALACLFVVLSAFVHRPYCRFVCPTGTLLKLAESKTPETSAE